MKHLRLISFFRFGFSLVLLFACLTSSVQAASPITGSGLNTQVSPPVSLPSGQTQYNITGGTVQVGQVGPTCSIASGTSMSQPPTSRTFSMTPASPHRTSSVVSPGEIFPTSLARSRPRVRERESLPDEPGWILVWAERYCERRRDGELQFSRLSSTGRRNTDSMPFPIQPQMRFSAQRRWPHSAS